MGGDAGHHQFCYSNHLEAGGLCAWDEQEELWKTAQTGEAEQNSCRAGEEHLCVCCKVISRCCCSCSHQPPCLLPASLDVAPPRAVFQQMLPLEKWLSNQGSVVAQSGRSMMKHSRGHNAQHTAYEHRAQGIRALCMVHDRHADNGVSSIPA